MRILGDKEDIVVSLEGLRVTTAYKLPRSNFYCVSIKDENKTYYKIHFSSSGRAKMLANTNKSQITLMAVPVVSTDTGTSTETLYFYKEVCMKEYEKVLNEDNSKPYSKETIVNSEDYNIDKDFDEHEDEDEDELIAKFEIEFAHKSAEAEMKAKNLLSSLSKFYLSVDMIDKNEYLKHKLELEQKGVAGLIFQLEVSRMAIKDVMLQIYLGKATSKQMDSLSKLQRIVLDINISISTLIKDSVKDMKDIKERYEEIKELMNSEDKTIEGNVVISGSNPTDVMKHLKEAMNRDSDMMKTIEEAEIEEISKESNDESTNS